MTTAFDQDRSPQRSEGTAANDDHVSHTVTRGYSRYPSQQTSETGGWDAYDVWRRLIKEARDRRAGGSLPE